MSKLLLLTSSPREKRSRSTAVAKAFAEACRKARPELEVVEKNVFEMDLPPFDGYALQAKYNIMHSRVHTPRELRAWSAVERLIEEFAAYDFYVVAAPMWNFSIPYRLKHYIDLICQPTYTFESLPGGAYQGLIQGKAATIYARGGSYPENTPAAAFNHQSPYLDFILGFMGLTVDASIFVEMTLADQITREARLDAAMAQAEELGAAFCS
ncbi:MAG: FMN-dependent NADH-azoreductase [Desulfovibrionales bacterium]|nr:FMN-dependent NADH-azoreductase [Desulfovibrionales bacterium]